MGTNGGSLTRSQMLVLVNELATIFAAVNLPTYGGIYLPPKVALERARAAVQFITLTYNVTPKDVR